MVAALAAFAGCVDDGEGHVAVYVKDAPADEFEEVWLAFHEVRVHAAGGDEDADDDNATEGWIVVSEGNRTINLLDYEEEGSRAFLGDANLSAGRYTQIRLMVTAAWGIDAEGNRTDIRIPNPTVKVVKSFEVEDGETTRLVIDVDLDRSLHGRSDAPVLTPVIGSVDVEKDVEDEGDDVADDG